MKIYMLLFALITTRGPAAPDPPAEPGMEAKLSAELRSDFPYRPAEQNKQSPAVASATPTQNVVVMPLLLVTAPNPNRLLVKKMDEERAKDDAFTWRNGGTILKAGPVLLEIKYDPTINRIKLLEFDW